MPVPTLYRSIIAVHLLIVLKAIFFRKKKIQKQESTEISFHFHHIDLEEKKPLLNI